MFRQEFCFLLISTLHSFSFGTNFPSYFVPSQVVYSRSGTSVRVGNQMPPHPEPDAILINVNNPGGPGRRGFAQPGGPGVFGQPGGPGVFGQPGGPGVFGQPGGPGVYGQPGGPGVYGQPGGPGVYGQPGGPGVYGQPGVPGVYGQPGVPGVYGQPGGPGVYGQPGGPGVFGQPGGPGVFGQPGGPGMFGPSGFGHPQLGVFGHPQPGTFRHMQPQPGPIPEGFVPSASRGWGFNVYRPQRPQFPGNSFIPNNGRGNSGGVYPGVEDGDSGREMFDEPTAEMFPLIDNAT